MVVVDKSLAIEDDIKRAETLPAEVYAGLEYYERARERVFARSWQLIGDTDGLKSPGSVVPATMLEGCLDEPLVLTRDSTDNINCLSNVCTHRGNLLVEGDCHTQTLRCRYHGRCFTLDGRFQSTPGFESAACFPSPADNLQPVPSARLWKFVFASIDPAFPFDELTADMQGRLGWLPFENFIHDPGRSRDYIVRANWALYCDNYLEGFHIPYVHPALASALDVKAYETIVFPYASLQVGVASNPGEAFTLPSSSPDYGKNIAAYYYWLFPNTMFNFYPWGLSINIVVPLAPDRCRVQYITYVLDESKLGEGAGADVDRTEREDEDIVEKVQRGVRSRFYRRGRYSPGHEAGVHHFHKLLTRFL